MKFHVHIFCDPRSKNKWMASFRTASPEVELGFGEANDPFSAIRSATHAAIPAVVNAFNLDRKQASDKTTSA